MYEIKKSSTTLLLGPCCDSPTLCWSPAYGSEWQRCEDVNMKNCSQVWCLSLVCQKCGRRFCKASMLWEQYLSGEVTVITFLFTATSCGYWRHTKADYITMNDIILKVQFLNSYRHMVHRFHLHRYVLFSWGCRYGIPEGWGDASYYLKYWGLLTE